MMTIATHDTARAGRTLGLLVAALIAAACGSKDAVAPTAAAAPPAGPVGLDVVRVVEQPLDVPLSLPGELTAFQSVAIFPRVAGFVKTVNVDRGSKVGAGDLLATLEAPELVAQRSEAQSKLQAAEAQLAAARSKADADRATFERLKAASNTPGVVAGNDVVLAEKASESSASQVLAAQQSVEAARQSLTAIRDMEGYLRMTAPFAGVVTERNVHPGALVGPSTAPNTPPLLRLVDANRLRLVVQVPEAYTAAMTHGADVTFTVAAFPGERFSGRIARVAQAVDVTTRTMAVELDVPNGDGRLAPGAFCQVRWPVRRGGASLFVPSTAIATTTDRTFVIRIRNGAAEWVDVKTGLTVGSLIEIFGDVHAGDEVARRGTDELRPGTPVRPQEAKPAT
jgi:RND family efflux transporter MFP subunit